MKMSGVADAILVVVAVVVGALVVKRELVGSATPAVAAGETTEYIADWQKLTDNGVKMGPANAELTVVEFGDIECPFCAKLNSQVKRWEEKYPGKVSFVFVHYPLSQHRFAEPGARAVECADSVGRAREMLDVLFLKQDSLGLKEWSSYAQESGIAQTEPFLRCVKGAGPFDRINAGLELGKAINVHGTPTVIVNGWRLSARGTELDAAVDKIMRGEKPVDVFTSASY